jgi:hypothetical protein
LQVPKSGGWHTGAPRDDKTGYRIQLSRGALDLEENPY